MAAVFALEALFAALKTAVETTWQQTVGTAPDTTIVKRVVVEWGRGRPQINTNSGSIGRVVVVPGDESGAWGEFTGAQQWSQPAQPLEALRMPFLVYCWGRSSTAQKENDAAHDHVAMLVLHEVVRQLRKISRTWGASGAVQFGKVGQVRQEQRTTLGRELVLQCSIGQPILDMFDDDLPYTDVSPGVADITDTLGNRSEISTTEE